MQYLCIHLCYTLLFHHVYTHLTALPRGLSSSALSLDQHHLDPWLAKLTCERALPGSTLPAGKSNLFSSDSGSSLTYLESCLRPCSSIFGSQTSLYQYQAYMDLLDQIYTHLSNTESRRTTKSIPGRSPFPRLACLFHVTVMVETRIQGTSPFDTADSCLYREPSEAGMNR